MKDNLYLQTGRRKVNPVKKKAARRGSVKDGETSQDSSGLAAGWVE